MFSYYYLCFFDGVELLNQSIGGRLVRVNEVTTRSGRSNPGRERFQPHGGGGGGWDKSPDRRRDCSYERDRYSERSRERDRSQDRRKGHYAEKERAYEHSHDFERRNDGDMVDRTGYKERVFEGDEGDWRGDRSYGDDGRGINGTSAQEGRSQETKREDR